MLPEYCIRSILAGQSPGFTNKKTETPLIERGFILVYYPECV